ncbi:MAG: hypothetical protein GEU90_21550 [Gemmatimonas sp.]|nr:hypothetical protein [Gemmatimonas sp.]
MPSVIASVVGFSIFGAVEGFTPIFGVLRTPQFHHPSQLLFYALLGIAAGLVARLYARGFYGAVRLTDRLPGHIMLKPAVAAVLVGLIGLALQLNDARVVDREHPTVSVGDRLDAALDALVSSSVSWLPATDARRRVAGIVGLSEVITSYRRELRKNLQLLSRVGGATTLIQQIVGASSPLANHPVATVPFPPGSVVLSIERGSQLLFPDAATVIHAGDVLSLVAPARDGRELDELMRGTHD